MEVNQYFGIGLFVVAIGFIFRVFKIKAVISHISENITSKIARFREGVCEFKGKAFTVSNLTAPFSGRSVLYYKLRIEEQTRTSRGQVRWRTVYSETVGEDFVINDGTGTALIRLNEAVSQKSITDFLNVKMIEPDNKSSLRTSYMEDTKRETIENYLRNRGINRFSFWAFLGQRNQYRYVEETIIEGDEIYVLGYVKKDSSDFNDCIVEYQPGKPFIVSGYTEEELKSVYGREIGICIAIAVGAIIIGAIFFGGSYQSMMR